MVMGLIFTAHKQEGKVCVEDNLYKVELEDEQVPFAKEYFEHMVRLGFSGKPLAYCIADSSEEVQIWGYYEGKSIENFLTMVEVTE